MQCLSCSEDGTVRKIGHPEGGSYVVCLSCGACERITRLLLREFVPTLEAWQWREIYRLQEIGLRLDQRMRENPRVLPSQLNLEGELL